MRLEELQAMSDKELNELSAFKVMGWKRDDEEFPETFDYYIGIEEKRVYHRWNPTNDMDNALELLIKTKPSDGRVELVIVDGVYVCNFFEDDIRLILSTEDKSLPRAATIAAILAKE